MLNSKFSSHHLIYFIGEILTKGIFFILLPFLGRMLSVSEFGVFSLVFPFIQLLLPTASFGLANALFRYYFEKGINKEVLFSSTLIAWFLLAVLCYPLFFWILHSSVISLYPLYKYQLGNFAAPLLISLLCLGFNQIFNESYRVQQRATSFIALNLLSRFIVVLSITATVYSDFITSIQLLWATALGSFIIFGYSVLLYIKNLKITVDWSLVKKLIQLGSPVMLTPLSVLLLYVGNRYVLNVLVSSDEVGIYSMAVSLVQIVALIPASFSRAWVPELFSRLRDDCADTEFFTKIVSYYMFLFIFFCLSFECSSSAILLAVGGTRYLGALPLIPILLSGFILEAYYTFSIDRLYYAKRVKTVIALTTFSGLFNIIISFILVSYFAMIGAAIAFALSMFVQAVLFARVARRIDRINLPYKQLFRYVFTGITGSALIWFNLSLENWSQIMLSYVLMITILCLIFRRDYVVIKNQKIVFANN